MNILQKRHSQLTKIKLNKGIQKTLDQTKNLKTSKAPSDKLDQEILQVTEELKLLNKNSEDL
jgi:cell division protein FtsB